MKKSSTLTILTLCLNVGLLTSVQAQTFEYKSHANASIASYSMPYRLYIPADYNPNNTYPLVLFLHGAGERGTDNNAQLTANKGATLWAEPANQASHPCFVVAPQCPADKQWVNTNWSSGSYIIDNVPMSVELKMVKDIIESLETQYNIDASRLFIDGLSMGGYGTWDFILRYPGMFKAAIPMCGAGDPTKASLISTLPLWVFHSNDDGAVPVSGSRDMVNAIHTLGFNDRTQFYSEYYNKGHVSAYETALSEPNLVDWLFNAEPVTITPGLVDISNYAGTSSAQGGNAPDAFDGAIYNKWLDFANDFPSTRSSWVQYHFTGGSYAVTQYTITSANDFPERDPTDWILLGSNNGADWTTLDTRTREEFSNRFHKNLYSFANTTDYAYYKLQINAVYKPNEANCVQLADIRLWMENEGNISTSVTGVTVSSTTASLDINKTLQLTAIIAPDNAADKSVTWSSSDPDIVFVSSTGLATTVSTGAATITVTTIDGGKTATCYVTVMPGMENLALNQTAVASAYEQTGLEPNKAVDGNTSTRWGSGFNNPNPEWIYVDLGATYSITGVKLVWETAYGKSYQIQVSNNATEWTDIYSTTTGDGGDDDLTGLTGVGRYVRVYATERGLGDGFSLYEIEVYGTNTVGINEIPESNILLYLNPGKSNLTIENIQPNSVIRAVSMDGRTVSKVYAKSGSVDFNISHWGKGVYVFYIETKKNVVVRKAIIP